jgi:HrpA-like RNA helicase
MDNLVNQEIIKNTYDYHRLKLKQRIIESDGFINPGEIKNIFHPNYLGLNTNDLNQPNTNFTLDVISGVPNLKLFFENGIQMDQNTTNKFSDQQFKDINGKGNLILDDRIFNKRYEFLTDFFSLEYQDNLENYISNYSELSDNIFDNHILNNRFKNFTFFQREIKPTYGKVQDPFFYFNSGERNKFFDYLNQENNLVSILTATTGSGKTTEIPLYFLEFGYSKYISNKKILVTEPRRISAKLPAEYISKLTDMPRKIIYEDFNFNRMNISVSKNYCYYTDSIYKFLNKSAKNLKSQIEYYGDINGKMFNKDFLKKQSGYKYQYLIGNESGLIIFTHPTENIYDVIEPKYYLPNFESYIYDNVNQILKGDNFEKIKINQIRRIPPGSQPDQGIKYGFINKKLFFKYDNDENNYYILKNYWDSYNKKEGIITFNLNDNRIIQKLNNDESTFKSDDLNYKIGSLSNNFCYYKNNQRKQFYLFQNAFYVNLEFEYDSENLNYVNNTPDINEINERNTGFSIKNIVNDGTYKQKISETTVIKISDIAETIKNRRNEYKSIPVNSNVIYLDKDLNVYEPFNNLENLVNIEVERIKKKYDNQDLNKIKLIYNKDLNKQIFNIHVEQEDNGRKILKNLNQQIFIIKVNNIFEVSDQNNNKIELELFLLEKSKPENIDQTFIDLYDVAGNVKKSKLELSSNIKNIIKPFHYSLLPLIRIYDKASVQFKYRYSKIHRLEHNFKPDIKIIKRDEQYDDSIEIKYYVQFINEEFSLFRRENKFNLGFTIIDRYEYNTEIKNFRLIERINNIKESLLGKTISDYSNRFNDIIKEQLDLYFTFSVKNKKDDLIKDIKEIDVAKYNESVKQLFNLNMYSLDNNNYLKYEFLDHTQNKIRNLELKKLIELALELKIKEPENKDLDLLVKEIVTHEDFRTIKRYLLVIDKNFKIKNFDQNGINNRKFNQFEEISFNNKITEFDFYRELLKINDLILNRLNQSLLDQINLMTDKSSIDLNLIINILNTFNNYENIYSSEYHIIKSNNFDIKDQKTIPLNISSIIGCKYKSYNKINDNTLIDFVTDGTFESELYTELQKNNNFYLDKYSCVLIDEAHERTIPTELIMALFKNKLLDNIVSKNKDFKLVIMSATINKEIFMNYYQTNYSYHIEGSTKDINIWYHNHDNINFIDTILNILDDIISGNYIKYDLEVKGYPNRKTPVSVNKDGGILIFLPSKKYIIDIEKLISNKFSNFKILQLYSGVDNQDEIVNENLSYWNNKDNNNYKGRIILSTNVAETSITPSDISYVVDCGYVQYNFYNPIIDIEKLEIIPTSINSMIQRMGRVGRNKNGNFFPIFTKKFFSFNDYLIDKKIDNTILVETLSPPIINTNIVNQVHKLFLIGLLSNPNDIISKFKMLNNPNFEILKNIVDNFKKENFILNKNNIKLVSNLSIGMITLNKNLKSEKVINFILNNKNYLSYLRDILIILDNIENNRTHEHDFFKIQSIYDKGIERLLYYHSFFKNLMLYNCNDNITSKNSVFKKLMSYKSKSSIIEHFTNITQKVLEDLKNIESMLKFNNSHNLMYIPEIFLQQPNYILNKNYVKDIQRCLINGYNNIFKRIDNTTKYKSLENSNIIINFNLNKTKTTQENNNELKEQPKYIHIDSFIELNKKLQPLDTSSVIFYFEDVVNEYLNNNMK